MGYSLPLMLRRGAENPRLDRGVSKSLGIGWADPPVGLLVRGRRSHMVRRTPRSGVILRYYPERDADRTVLM